VICCPRKEPSTEQCQVELEPYALEECRRLLLAATELPNGARWSVALALGLRQGETLGLMWDDIDFEKQQIRVRGQLQRPGWHHGCGDPQPDHKPSKCPERTGGGWIFEDVKSRAGRRTLAVPPQRMQQLREHRRDQAAQQLATGDYWKPFYYLLEDLEGVEVMLVNARHVKNLPGRKTDVADATWLAQLGAHGLVRGSFVPPAPIRELRDLTRARTAITRERGREVQRLEKLLEDAKIKLSSVASDITGVSGRAMLEALTITYAVRLAPGVGER